ncbi:MAG TPA: hypothetical protein VGS61_02115 [Acidimicrobiales bacterium]|nr:hypothetical protein [Acidimicrobiales bacterium]
MTEPSATRRELEFKIRQLLPRRDGDAEEKTPVVAGAGVGGLLVGFAWGWVRGWRRARRKARAKTKTA